MEKEVRILQSRHRWCTDRNFRDNKRIASIRVRNVQVDWFPKLKCLIEIIVRVVNFNGARHPSVRPYVCLSVCYIYGRLIHSLF